MYLTSKKFNLKNPLAIKTLFYLFLFVIFVSCKRDKVTPETPPTEITNSSVFLKLKYHGNLLDLDGNKLPFERVKMDIFKKGLLYKTYYIEDTTGIVVDSLPPDHYIYEFSKDGFSTSGHEVRASSHYFRKSSFSLHKLSSASLSISVEVLPDRVKFNNLLENISQSELEENVHIFLNDSSKVSHNHYDMVIPNTYKNFEHTIYDRDELFSLYKPGTKVFAIAYYGYYNDPNYSTNKEIYYNISPQGSEIVEFIMPGN